MVPYIIFNSDQQTKAVPKRFGVELFKLINNSVFVKIMDDSRKRK